MSKEIWKDIEGFPNYQVSSLGRVRNRDKHIIHQQKRKNGYVKVELWKNGKGYTRDVHRLVAIAFLEPGLGQTDVNHVDGHKDNNIVTNLEWCTKKENMQHAMATGLYNPIPPSNEDRKQPIRIIETGEVFDSISSCAKAIGSSVINIVVAMREDVLDHHSVKGLHFERITKEEYEKETCKKRKPFLYDYQMDAVNRLRNGCILCGSVGSGKSRSGLFYYFKENGGWIDEDGYKPMKNPQDLYIITTAKKRDSLEFEGELAHFLLSTNEKTNAPNGNKIVIDSWNNLPKYSDVEGAFFLLDEQRLVSYGAWTKAFLKIAKYNNWILLTATPADSYQDFLPVFLANGFFKNKTEFNREHVIFSRYTKYPKIDRYINTTRLDRLRDRILVKMNYQHQINTHHEYVYCRYNVGKYKEAIRNRWDPYKNEPIEQASGLCFTLRRIVNSDEDRQVKILELLENVPKAIIFYNFNYERDILLNLAYQEGTEVAEWSGNAHQPIPKSERWVYLCQYTSACEGWENTQTDTIIFYSQNYSYKVMTQAAGRIDRLNTPFKDLYYYHLCSRSGIDLAISKALDGKKKFNERKWTKWDK